jgi:hypothetical protein
MKLILFTIVSSANPSSLAAKEMLVWGEPLQKYHR